MPIVDCKIEIPEGYELAEPLPRPGRRGESLWIPAWKKPYVHSGGISSQPYFIIRPIWQWPEWLLAEWIIQQSDGLWWGCEQEPQLTESAWYSYGKVMYLDNVEKLFVAFTPPPCTDWKTSKRRNPRCQKNT